MPISVSELKCGLKDASLVRIKTKQASTGVSKRYRSVESWLGFPVWLHSEPQGERETNPASTDWLTQCNRIIWVSGVISFERLGSNKPDNLGMRVARTSRPMMTNWLLIEAVLLALN